MRVCLATHQLGGFNGVACEAAKWCAAFADLGWSVTRAAGNFTDTAPGDVLVRGMWADRPGGDPPPVDHDTIKLLCQTHDLVVLDNAGTLFSAPLAASAWEHHALAAGVPVVLRHHDPPWQCAPFGPVTADTIPLHDPGHLHVTINALTADDFAQRWPGLVAAGALRVVYNRIDADELRGGQRDRARAGLGVAPHEVLILHPARAGGARKNIPGAVQFALNLAGRLTRPVRYWLTDGLPHPPASVAEALRNAPGLIRGNMESKADMYAAADLVILPSSWEGWGLPVVESAAARLPIVAGPYPVLDEIRSFGITVYDPSEIDTVAEYLTRRPGLEETLDSNEAAVRKHFDLASLPATLASLAASARHLRDVRS